MDISRLKNLSLIVTRVLINLIEKHRFGKFSLLMKRLLCLFSEMIQALEIVLLTLELTLLLNQELYRLKPIILVNLDHQILLKLAIRYLYHHRVQLMNLLQLFLCSECL